MERSLVIKRSGAAGAAGTDACRRGGGVKGGITYGATDEIGYSIVSGKTEVFDIQATILHLLGFDHEKFTYQSQGRPFRLTDVSGKVIHDILA